MLCLLCLHSKGLHLGTVPDRLGIIKSGDVCLVSEFGEQGCKSISALMPSSNAMPHWHVHVSEPCCACFAWSKLDFVIY